MEERSLIMTISLVASSQTQFNNPYEARISKAKTLLKFSYSELELATGGFSLVNSLADGDFGSVHRGVLSYDQAIAVMQLKLASSQGTISSVPSLKFVAAVFVGLVSLWQFFGCWNSHPIVCLKVKLPLPKTARFWGMRIDNILVAHHFLPMMKNGMVQSAQMSMELDMKKGKSFMLNMDA
ncbi:hypothetical protein HPP92_005267 [Vanilla planifolia]|uniref:non-specific serine/threonine protein kinase n=1 Tax=Vanilla planifolia TaxID=51239 RepID=A0A835VEG8_VANPL|nr:hypothetical protein HPP92_005267 [Vanilla planifolia]